MRISKKVLVGSIMLLTLISSNLVYAALIPTEVLMNQNLTITYNNDSAMLSGFFW